ncbi:hypothetical protein PSSY5922_27280 [Pseudomonas synxantha]
MHVDTAGTRYFQGIGRIGEADHRIAAARSFSAETDIILHGDGAIATILRQIGKRNGVGGLQQHVSGLRLQCLFRYAAAGNCVTRCTAAADRNSGGVQQQIAGTPVRGACIGDTAVLQCLFAGHLGLAAITALRAATYRNGAGEARTVIRPEHCGTAIALAGRIGTHRRACIHRDPARVGDTRVLALPAAAHLDRAAAVGAAGIQRSPREGDLLAGDNDVAALALLRRDIEHPSHLGRAALIVTVQHDTAIALEHALGFDEASVVDHAADGCIGRACTQRYQATVSADLAAVLHQRIQHAAVDIHADQAIAGEIQADFVTRGKRRAAARRMDHPAVADLRPDQCDHATFGGGDTPLVTHRAGTGTAAEGGFTGQEIFIADLQRRGDQPAHIDLGAFTDDHATGIQ